MPQKKKVKQLTMDDIKKVEAMAAVRLPNDMIATILGIGHNRFTKMLKLDAALREAMERGRANASGTVRNTLYQMAIGAPAVKGVDGKLIEPKKPPEFQALKFWCQTQEGFKIADKIELSGPDGAPIATTDKTREEKLALLKEINKKLKITEDE